MGLRSLEVFYSYSVVIDFRRQNLTSKVDPRTVRVNPCPAERFFHFSSFEAGIANAISSFK